MMGSTCSVGENCSTSMPCAVGSGSSAISSSVSTTISPLGSSYPLATSAYGTSSPSTEQIRRNRIRPPSVRCTWRNVTSRCSVAEYSRTGIMTRPNEISPLHIARMVSQYPLCLCSRVVLLSRPWRNVLYSARACHDEQTRAIRTARYTGEWGEERSGGTPEGITDERERTGTASGRSRGTATRGVGGPGGTACDGNPQLAL